MKVYARQINPEHQESPLYYDSDSFPDNIAVFGNKDFGERMPDVVRHVREVLEDWELAEILMDIESGRIESPVLQFTTVEEAIADFLPPVDREKYTPEEVKTLQYAVICFMQSNYTEDENKNLCKALSIVTGQKWHYQQITGSCQGDWNDLYYTDAWSRDDIGVFETEYFNEGSEWIIHDEEEAPETPEDVTGYSVYCTSWRDEDIRAELAAVAGCTPENVVMYKWTGTLSTDVYMEV